MLIGHIAYQRIKSVKRPRHRGPGADDATESETRFTKHSAPIRHPSHPFAHQ